MSDVNQLQRPTITQIRERLEAKAGADAGTRPYWDCVEALLDIAEAAALVDAVMGPLEVTHKVFQYDCLDRLHIALAALTEGES